MQSYDISSLTPNDPTSKDWALAWCRLLAKDVPTNDVYPAHSLQDEEWIALLEVTATEDDEGTIYYRPWKSVAMKLSTDPTYALSVTEDGYSGTFRNPQELISHLENVGNTFSSLYPDEVQTVNFSLTPRF